MEYLSAYLTCLCKVEDSINNVFYGRHFPHWQRRVLGIEAKLRRAAGGERGTAKENGGRLWRRHLRVKVAAKGGVSVFGQGAIRDWGRIDYWLDCPVRAIEP